MTLIAAASIALASTQFVQADALNLRESADEAPFGRLPRNAAVEVVEERGANSKIRLPARPESHRKEVWVPSEFLGAEPSDEPVLGGTTTFFAQCNGERVEVLSRYEDGEFSGVTAHDDHAALASLSLQLAGVEWFWASEHTSGTVERGSFATPFLAPIYNEDGGDAWSAGDSMLGGEEKKIVLGPCSERGTLYSTTRLTPSSHPKAAAKEKRDAWLDEWTERTGKPSFGGRVWRPVADLPFYEVLVDGPWEMRTCGGVEEGVFRAYRWVLVDENGSPKVGPAESEYGISFPLHGDEPTRWVRFGEGAALGVFQFTHGMGESTTLTAIAGDDIATTSTSLVGWGC